MTEEVRIEARHRGPFVVRGQVTLVNEAGEVVDLGERTRLALCRCGTSKTKPFCDGSHNRLPA